MPTVSWGSQKTKCDSVLNHKQEYEQNTSTGGHQGEFELGRHCSSHLAVPGESSSELPSRLSGLTLFFSCRGCAVRTLVPPPGSSR